jgi:biofilm protein TabA
MIIDYTANFLAYRHLFKDEIAETIWGKIQEEAIEFGDSGSIKLMDNLLTRKNLRLRTVDRETARYESHREFVDVQFILGGGELIDWSYCSCLMPDGEYDDSIDFQFYCDYDSGSTLRVSSGMFLVFFPWDGHRPMISDGASSIVEKSVFKVHRSACVEL